MNPKNKTFILSAIILVGSVIGVFFIKPPAVTDSVRSVVDPPSAVYGSGGVPVYSKQANAIVVGNVREVTDPYLTPKHQLTIQQDAQVDVEEVLKGDASRKNVKITGLAIEADVVSPENIETLKGKYELLVPGEHVLLFLGTNSSGEYVVFGGPYGKYLIDKDNNVSSIGDVKMSLADLKQKIQVALKEKVS